MHDKLAAAGCASYDLGAFASSASPFGWRIGCAARNAKSSAIASSIRRGLRPIYSCWGPTMAAFFQATARVSGAGVSNCCAMARRQFTTSVTRSSRSYGGWLPHHVAIGLKCFHGETLCAWPWRSLRSSKTRLGRHGDGFRSRLRLGGCSGSQIDGVAIGRRRRGQQKTRKTAPFPVALRRFDSAFGPRFDAACPPPARRSPSPKCAPVAFGSPVVPPARVRSSARCPPKSTRRSGLPIADDRGHPWAMSTKSRESIYGCSIRSSAERAKEARKGSRSARL